MNAPTMSIRRGAERRAFTLVELLVVVSIIALLIAILLPSLKKARESAKRVACTANVRSIAQAGLTYASEDREELAIPIGLGDAILNQTYPSYYGFGGKTGRGRFDLSNSPFARGFSMQSDNRPLNRVLYPKFQGGQKLGGGGGGGPRGGGGGSAIDLDADLDVGIYRCPGDRGFPGMHHRGWKDSGLNSYDYYGTSYAANPLYVGIQQVNTPLWSNAIYKRPLSRVPSPNDTVLYWENAARFALFATNPEEYDQNGCFWPYSIGGMIAFGNHNEPFHFNVAYGDGHSTWIKIKGHGLLGDPRVASQNRCILIRGLGWRLDTQPAALVKTNKVNLGGAVISSTDGANGNIWELAEK